MLIDAALITILVANMYLIPLPTNDTNDPKLDTASTDSEIDDEETRYVGQQQGSVDIKSDITQAKELYDKTMLPILSVEEVCSAFVLARIKRESKQTMTTRTAILGLQYLNMLSIWQRVISKLSIWSTGNYTFKQSTACGHICSIWSQKTCKVGPMHGYDTYIAANDT